jgi:hypothetical protein
MQPSPEQGAFKAKPSGGSARLAAENWICAGQEGISAAVAPMHDPVNAQMNPVASQCDIAMPQS